MFLIASYLLFGVLLFAVPFTMMIALLCNGMMFTSAAIVLTLVKSMAIALAVFILSTSAAVISPKTVDT